jgi:hypothetical protein
LFELHSPLIFGEQHDVSGPDQEGLSAGRPELWRITTSIVIVVRVGSDVAVDLGGFEDRTDA